MSPIQETDNFNLLDNVLDSRNIAGNKFKNVPINFTKLM